MWWNEYIGLKYVSHGRDRSGLDCWGLVRLVYKEQFDKDLPSFSEHDPTDKERIAEIMAINREGWNATKVPNVGDVVLFRIAGHESHVGLYIGEQRFLHIRSGQDSVIERLDSARWKSRVVGFFRYDENSVTGSIVPHPLKTERFDVSIKSGVPIAEIVADFQHQLKDRFDCSNSVVMLDGRIVPQADWASVIPAPGQRVEYRALAQGGDTLKSFIRIAAVIAIAYVATPYVATAFGVQSGTLAYMAVSAGVNIAATYLVNSIFPVRPPELPSGQSVTQGKSSLYIQSGRNEATPFGAIPVVLGSYRYVAPLAAEPYLESTATINYLRMILCWGYGPMYFTDLRIGDTPISDYNDVDFETINDFDTDKTDDEVARFNNLYGKDITQEVVSTKLTSDGTDEGSEWITRVISESVTQLQVVIDFPRGLRALASDGENAGKTYAAPFKGEIQFRKLDPDTLEPVESFINGDRKFIAQTAYAQNCWVNNLGYIQQYYQWTVISLDAQGKIVKRVGSPSDSIDANPTSAMIAVIKAQNYGWDFEGFKLKPTIPASEITLYEVCFRGDTHQQTNDLRGDSPYVITGGDLTRSGLKLSIAAGAIAKTAVNVSIGDSGEPYHKRIDAFAYVQTFDVDSAPYEVRVRRTNNDQDEYTSGGVKYTNLHDAYLSTITGYANTKPVIAPKGVQLCMTAIRIRATDQINGNIDAISALCWSVCKDYDADTDTWIVRPTNNPASLLRFVLQHPANAKAVADSKINLTDLAEWHTYCADNEFTFNMVIMGQRSLLDVLRDVAAAGRASPTIKDGKWTVVVDKPRVSVAQYFTPHNSWGFEATKLIPTVPHAFRVVFNNEEKGFQPDERIVYDDGYTASNATLFEQLSLPGVTRKDLAFKQARFHLAQIKLRPETYVINADMENIVCTRGDLVRVTHDVPMWGLGTGRIKNRVDSTTLELDEQMPMDSGVQYTIRIRLEDGTSITRTVAAKVSDGYYSTITLTSSVTTTEGKAGNLFMFGALSEESVELIVQAIEPADNYSARITLVDYSPAVYDSDTEEIPAFDSQITKPPFLQQQKITQKPVITSFDSDESVMIRLGPGKYEYRLRVFYRNPAGLNRAIEYVEAQLDFDEDDIEEWNQKTIVPVKTGQITFANVVEGDAYKVRLRYHDTEGRFGPWVYSDPHTIVGRTAPPSAPTEVTATVENNKIRLNWEASPEPDVEQYEIRTADSGWGSVGYVARAKTTTALVGAPAVGSSQTWYIKAIDSLKNYSETAASVTFTPSAVTNVSNVTFSFFDTSKTSATLTLDWDDAAPELGLNYYLVSYNSTSKRVKASTITVPADWIGSRAFTIQTVDLNGNQSSGTVTNITKLVPNQPPSLRASVIDNNVMLYWTEPTVTTLPISHYFIKKGDTYATAEDVGRKDGLFTTINESAAGTYKYWVETVDTDGYASTARSVTAKVAAPPDFVLFQTFESTFTGTLSSAILDNGSVVLTANTTETWADHFTNNSWTTIQDQIDAGYPYYIQPTTASGYYEEVFDYGTVLSSSSITIDYGTTVVAGAPTVTTRISVSDDNVTYTDNDDVDQIYATNFRYVKVRITVASTGDDVLLLNNLDVRLDAKLINDAGKGSALAADTSGTVFNFNKTFVDVQSITVTPQGTDPLTAVYAFTDLVITGTYSITSNVATISATAHGLVAGQNVRLTFTSGGAPDGVYPVASVTNANTYTVSITTSDTSGNLSTYPEGFRVYVFDDTGTRADATISWAVKGY